MGYSKSCFFRLILKFKQDNVQTGHGAELGWISPGLIVRSKAVHSLGKYVTDELMRLLRASSIMIKEPLYTQVCSN